MHNPQTRRQYGIKDTAAISLTFDLHCKAMAALLFIPYSHPIWGHCPNLILQTNPSTCDYSLSYQMNLNYQVTTRHNLCTNYVQYKIILWIECSINNIAKFGFKRHRLVLNILKDINNKHFISINPDTTACFKKQPMVLNTSDGGLETWSRLGLVPQRSRSRLGLEV